MAHGVVREAPIPREDSPPSYSTLLESPLLSGASLYVLVKIHRRSTSSS